MVVSSLSLLAGLHGGSDRESARHPVRGPIYLGAALTGVAGTGFHLYNITKRPGGWSWPNLFYAAPIARRWRCYCQARSAPSQKSCAINPRTSHASLACPPGKPSRC
ncbi:hypothetical protein [Paraburkholderia sprentiae]|uniref:hypothetical protein n=1 Tax=Paraburkholderia sprentiae TaxID=948107 RepID=UPI0004266F21